MNERAQRYESQRSEIKSLDENFRWKSAKFVPHSGWNFASSPTDRENIAENFANSQFYSTQTCQPRKKVKENS